MLTSLTVLKGGGIVYVSLGTAARELGVTTATARRWTSIGFLPCIRTAGGHRRIDTRDIEELARAIGGGTHRDARRAREREVETLVQASIDVAGRLEQGELLAEIARHVTSLCDCHTCEVLEYDAGSDAVRVLAEYDAGGGRRPTAGVFPLAGLPVTRRVLDEQTPICVNADERGADPAEVALMRQYGEKSILMLPLAVRGETIGLLEACDRERARRYSPQELRLARALAGHAAVALRNAQLFAAARDAGEALAGLRRRLDDLAAGLSGPEARSPTPAAFAETLRAALGAHSCVVSLDGRALGAAVEPEPSGTAAPAREAAARLVRGGVRRGEGRLEITATLPRPAAGDAELLALAATVAPDWPPPAET